VEKCHRNIVPGGCAIFQAGGLIVVIVEIFRKGFLASVVPVIVNAVLNEHHLVTDVVAFVSKGDFPRSRLGEKQRGKILASWVTRKMRSIAQFSIRDPEGPDSQITEVAEPGMAGRTSTSTFRNGGGPGSVRGSLRMESTLGMTTQMQNLGLQAPSQGQQQSMQISLPTGISEMPSGPYPDSIQELPTGSFREQREGGPGGDDTPTEARKEFPSIAGEGGITYSPIDSSGVFDDSHPQLQLHDPYKAAGHTSPPPHIRQPGLHDEMDMGPPQPSYGNKPFLDNGRAHSPVEGDRWTLPSQQQGGGLRVANRTSMASDSDDDWSKEAIMQMNFAGDNPNRVSRFGGVDGPHR